MQSNNTCIVGVSDHGGWAILVTVAPDGSVIDRRRVELVDDSLPAIPHHHEAQMLPVEEGVALVERVRASAEKHATLALEALSPRACRGAAEIKAIALRKLQPLPPTIAERLKNVRARNVADWVMYRNALAAAAEARGWQVHWFDPKTVFDTAARALHVDDLDAHFVKIRKELGPPWTQDHKIATAAAIAASRC